MRKSILLFAGLALALVPAISLAHKGAVGIVKERMDRMSAIAKSTKQIGLMISGRAELDRGIIADEAGKIAKHATMVPSDFKMQMESAVSEASPKIWQELEAFNNISADMKASADELQQLALENADIDALKTAFGAVGATCADCHKAYRIKN